MKINTEISLCYDDVLLRPVYSEILPAAASTHTFFSKNIKLNIPIVSSAMDTVTEYNMANEMSRLGGLGVVHKNMTSEKLLEIAKNLKANKSLSVFALGVGDKEKQKAHLLSEYVDAFVVDTAHGHSKGVLEMVKYLKESFPKIDIIGGNVATVDACKALVEAGVDAVKVGIGPGSICTTRIVTGVGVPQFQAVVDCSQYLRSVKIPLIADGGIKYSGDLVKALAAGASTVMVGSLLAGVDESASETISLGGKTYKRYRGMGSLGAMGLGSKDRYGQGDVEDEKKFVPEGVEGLINYQGKLEDIIYQLSGGVRSAMGYLGARDLNELFNNASFIKVSSNSLKENHPHGIEIDIKAPNYR